MPSRAGLAVLLTAVASFGCVGMPQAVTVNPSDKPSSDASANTEKRIIRDPVVGGDAIEVTIPAKWHFQGAMYLMAEGGGSFNGDRCSSYPTGAYRATSPDGLSFMEALPSPAWGWASGPDSDFYGVKNCFPLQSPTSAQDLVKYISALLGVEYVRDLPVPAERVAQVQKKIDDANASYAKLNESGKYPSMHQTSELAWAEVRYKNGTFDMKGRLRAQVSCTDSAHPPLTIMSNHEKKAPTTVDRCQSFVLVEAAPESDFSALVEEWDRPGMGPRLLDTWVQAWVNRSTASWRGGNGFIENERRLSWGSKVQHSESVRKKMIAEFDVVFQKGLDKALADAAEKSKQESSLSADWTDYLLHGELMEDPARPELESPPPLFSRWVDANGTAMFETKEADSDPNGILPGTWSKEIQSQKSATADSAGASSASGPLSQH